MPNHDDQKIMYSSKDEADRVVERMQNQRVRGWKTLNSYLNRELQGWFVGNTAEDRVGAATATLAPLPPLHSSIDWPPL
tara:strand:- start:87 stop:323 length:237 start_codon:yes stop_codon:yes gene_type:complete